MFECSVRQFIRAEIVLCAGALVRRRSKMCEVQTTAVATEVEEADTVEVEEVEAMAAEEEATGVEAQGVRFTIAMHHLASLFRFLRTHARGNMAKLHPKSVYMTIYRA